MSIPSENRSLKENRERKVSLLTEGTAHTGGQTDDRDRKNNDGVQSTG